ncbi:uncharacterized protein EV422DRAFT_522869, partial [Fimicolochytrium jonesii]|uniref:uncharacterized protein n=1 Tax=Fimicolochytrium jonesii TaxID=1396493 RepID=UPI0022FEF6B7
MASGFIVNKGLTFVLVLGGMYAGSNAIQRLMKPDMVSLLPLCGREIFWTWLNLDLAHPAPALQSIPDLLADPALDPKAKKQEAEAHARTKPASQL